MAGISTLSDKDVPRKSPIHKSGVLTVHGFGVGIRIKSGHLEAEFGVGSDRSEIRLARVGHRLKRLVCISEDGFITLGALKWLADVGASFVMLNRTGRTLFVTGPTAHSDVPLRRAQALAQQNGKALEISRELIRAKLEGQQQVVREQLKELAVAELIARFRDRLADAESLDVVRYLEAQAAAAYWNAWGNVPVLFPRRDEKLVPAHWLRFGTRHSPLTGQPRLAINPANAILNYTFSLAESECRIALCSCGLDASMGFIHVDRPYRDSLALDLLETIRPSIEAWLLAWIMREPLRRSDFFETGTGNCRLRSHLCSQLSGTAASWARLVAPWAEYVAGALWSTTRRQNTPPTRLTQQNKREAKGAPSLPKPIAPPRRENVCRGCGKTIQRGREHCSNCMTSVSAQHMRDIAHVGRIAASTAEANVKRTETQRRNAIARNSWNPASQPAWLTPEVYSEKIEPLIAKMSGRSIAKAIGVTRAYAGRIREGRCRPHPRHWQALAELVGVVSNESG